MSDMAEKEEGERIKFIERFFAESKEYVNKGDPVQASEKLYKVVEECIKLLAGRQKLPEFEEARREGRWMSRLLVRAARRLAQDTGRKEIEDAWARAFNLHAWGFHENALDIEDVKRSVSYIERLLNYTKDSL
ncbi:MAG: hypothetical protein COX52_06060 [Syntrophobacterales bacterium CG23_combo_of_CG06-09_8_20_14_all_48_27]|nr:MAG: hypothetical protein COX52_06060 [Syntrophobacterales bacterium CG23_combo_of_CG06-09_8_20_14_all_48_27]